MPFRLDISRYSRPALRLIPTSVDHLLKSERMVMGIVENIYGWKKEDIERIWVKQRVRRKGHIQGNLSESGRLTVGVLLNDGRQTTHHWFVKVMPEISRNDLTSRFNVFTNEIAFYTKIVPELKKFVLEEKLDPTEAEFDIPTILFAKEDATGAIIILQDVIEDGFTQERDENDQRFLSVEKAIVAVESLARFHGISMAFQKKDSAKMEVEHPSLKKAGHIWSDDLLSEKLTDIKDCYEDALSQSTSPDSPALLARFKRSFSSSDRVKELCVERCDPNTKIINVDKNRLQLPMSIQSLQWDHGASLRTRNMICLQHGDFHFNNLLFRKDKDRWKVTIVDWQLTYIGRATGDISYLLLSSMKPDVREQFQEEIKQRYFLMFNKTFRMFEQKYIDNLNNNSTGIKIVITDCNDIEMEEAEFVKSLPMSFFISCGNVMIEQPHEGTDNDQCQENHTIGYAHDLCKEAVLKNII